MVAAVTAAHDTAGKMTDQDKERAQVTALVRELFRKLNAAGHSHEKIGHDLGISKAYVSQIKNDSANGRIGASVESAVARALYGGSVDALRRDAAAKFPNPLASATQVVIEHVDPRSRIMAREEYLSLPSFVQEEWKARTATYVSSRETHLVKEANMLRALADVTMEWKAGLLTEESAGHEPPPGIAPTKPKRKR